MDRIQRIDEIIEENSLLKHRFYTMWSEGDLDINMLAGYSKEYYQLVKAIPALMENTMRCQNADILALYVHEGRIVCTLTSPRTADHSILVRDPQGEYADDPRIDPTVPLSDILARHLQEEYEHIPLWEEFAAGLGVSRTDLESYSGVPQTSEAISLLEEATLNYYTGAAAMYALEKEIPRISSAKMEGLARFYGIDDDDTIEYFVEHMEADIRHAESWHRVLEGADSADIVGAARQSMRAQNLLLDGCYATYCNNN